jgi:RHS repeat-associated protein
MVQNIRQLPQRSTDTGGALDHQYAYDGNGNVLSTIDHNDGARSRWMAYDGMDRLTDAGSVVYGGDHWHRFTYDQLDNLRSWKLAGAKDFGQYIYTDNRLAQIKTTAGSVLHNLSYDAQGNLSTKDLVNYSFDFGNRLRSVTGGPVSEYYRYDGHGRRVLAWTPAGSKLSMYSSSGQPIYQQSDPKALMIETIYLGGSVVAVREGAYSGGHVVKYQHTDALGSPVAESNQAGVVTNRINYDPYGSLISGTAGSVGYTGHVMDPVTGLTYMQQRYYDPAVGRFLSADPMPSDIQNGWNFNRYNYGANNPLRFTDPDGRMRSSCTSSAANAAMCANPETAAGVAEGASGAAGGSSGAPGFTAGVLTWLGITSASESGEEGGDKPQYPTNPDDWEVPDGWSETSAGQNTGGRNRQWKDEEGRIRRRWDREGRENGKERGPHWHDSDDDSGGKDHIEPDDAPEQEPPPEDRA